MDRRGFLAGIGVVASGFASWLTLPKAITTPGYQQGWDDAMSTLSYQLEVAEARGEARGRESERARLRFSNPGPMPTGWSRRTIALKKA